MSNQQTVSVLQINKEEPLPDKSQPVNNDHCLLTGNDNENKENGSQISSKKLKKAEKLTALAIDFYSQLRLKKVEFEMKAKKLDLEMQRFEEKGAQNLEYQKEAIHKKDLHSDDYAATGIRI